jgi:hypothetical protein
MSRTPSQPQQSALNIPISVDQSTKQTSPLPRPAVQNCCAAGCVYYLEAGGAFAVGFVLQGPHLGRRRRRGGRHGEGTERAEGKPWEYRGSRGRFVRFLLMMMLRGRPGVHEPVYIQRTDARTRGILGFDAWAHLVRDDG